MKLLTAAALLVIFCASASATDYDALKKAHDACIDPANTVPAQVTCTGDKPGRCQIVKPTTIYKNPECDKIAAEWAAYLASMR